MKYIEKNEEPKQFILWKEQEAETLEMKYVNCEKEKISAEKIWSYLPSSAPKQLEEGIIYYDKEQLKTSLLKEQGKICCYCGKKINVENADIEHFELKSLNSRKTFDYHNLWASCKEPIYDYLRENEKTWEDIAKRLKMEIEILKNLNPTFNIEKGRRGDKIKIHNDLHCNQERGDKKDKIISPADKECEQKFSYHLTEEKGINYLEINGLAECEEAQNSIKVLNLNTKWLKIERQKTYENVNKVIIEIRKQSNGNPMLIREKIKQQIDIYYNIEQNDYQLRAFCFVMVYGLKNYLKN